jgi:hypothetical protein
LNKVSNKIDRWRDKENNQLEVFEKDEDFIECGESPDKFDSSSNSDGADSDTKSKRGSQEELLL